MKRSDNNSPRRVNRGGGRRGFCNKYLSRIQNKKFILFGFLILSLSILVSALLLQTLTQSDFNEGTYNQTYYNTTYNAVQVNLSYDSGNYTSKVFNTSQSSFYQNLTWHEERISCPEGMAYINKLNGFCIDKYEATCWNADGSFNTTSETTGWNAGNTTKALANNAYANSSAGKYPWVYISQIQARTACENAGKHLCTDEQWLASANIKGVVFNLATTITDCNVVSGSPAECQNIGPNDGDACNTSHMSDCYSSEGVYDMVGNVWEWTNETVGYTKPCDTAINGWCYWNGTDFTTSANAVYGNDGVYFTANTTTNKAVLRGGLWNRGAAAGPFCAHLNSGPTYTNFDIGFRCCSSS